MQRNAALLALQQGGKKKSTKLTKGNGHSQALVLLSAVLTCFHISGDRRNAFDFRAGSHFLGAAACSE